MADLQARVAETDATLQVERDRTARARRDAKQTRNAASASQQDGINTSALQNHVDELRVREPDCVRSVAFGAIDSWTANFLSWRKVWQEKW